MVMHRIVDVDNEIGQELPERRAVTPEEWVQLIDAACTESEDWREELRVASTLEITGTIRTRNDIIDEWAEEFWQTPACQHLVFTYYRDGILGFIRGTGVRPDDAEDILQDTFAAVSGLESVHNVGGALWTVARNKCVDRLREYREAIEVIESDLGHTTDEEQGKERPMELEDIEALGHHNSPWRAIDEDSPQEIVTAADLRDFIFKVGNKQSPRNFAIYLAVRQDGRKLGEVAREFELDVRTIGRILSEFDAFLERELNSHAVS